MISVVIVNFNGKKRLKKCIDNLLIQTYKNFEIIIVDNWSNDDSLEFLAGDYGAVKLIKSWKNWWFAYWNNLWIDEAIWEYILLLNNDIWIDDDFLERYINSFEACGYDILWVAEKNYEWEDLEKIACRIDIFGHPVFENLIYNLWYKDVFYAQWSSLLFKKSLYIDTGKMDEDFFMYCEEVDRQRRCLLYWYKIGIDTNIYVYHAWWWSTWSWIKYNVFLRRNQNTLQMLLKNYSLLNLIWIIPIYIFINIWEIFWLILFGKFRIAYTYILWWIYNIQIYKKIIQKRNLIQKSRKIWDWKVMEHMYKWFWKFMHLLNYIKKW